MILATLQLRHIEHLVVEGSGMELNYEEQSTGDYITKLEDSEDESYHKAIMSVFCIVDILSAVSSPISMSSHVTYISIQILHNFLQATKEHIEYSFFVPRILDANDLESLRQIQDPTKASGIVNFISPFVSMSLVQVHEIFMASIRHGAGRSMDCFILLDQRNI